LVLVKLLICRFTNTKTWQAKSIMPNRNTMSIEDWQFLAQDFDWQTALNDPEDIYWRNTQFNNFTRRFDTWSARVGARFSF
jgi:hypothetical protein